MGVAARCTLCHACVGSCRRHGEVCFWMPRIRDFVSRTRGFGRSATNLGRVLWHVQQLPQHQRRGVSETSGAMSPARGRRGAGGCLWEAWHVPHSFRSCAAVHPFRAAVPHPRGIAGYKPSFLLPLAAYVYRDAPTAPGIHGTGNSGAPSGWAIPIGCSAQLLLQSRPAEPQNRARRSLGRSPGSGFRLGSELRVPLGGEGEGGCASDMTGPLVSQVYCVGAAEVIFCPHPTKPPRPLAKPPGQRSNVCTGRTRYVLRF